MKIFKYEKGHTALVTMTVSELRERLSAFPPDMPVFGAWEGVWGEFRPEGFKVERSIGLHPDNPVDSLIVDVDQRHDHGDFKS